MKHCPLTDTASQQKDLFRVKVRQPIKLLPDITESLLPLAFLRTVHLQDSLAQYKQFAFICSNVSFAFDTSRAIQTSFFLNALTFCIQH